MDFITGAKVVLANSSVIDVSETEHPDIFWAVRGAGSSMGVAAEFTFKTFEVPSNLTIYSIPINWKVDKAVANLKAFQDFAENMMPPELNMRLFIANSFANFEGLYWGDKEGLKAAVAPLLNRTGTKLAFSQTGDWLAQLAHFGNGLALNQTHPYTMVCVFLVPNPVISHWRRAPPGFFTDTVDRMNSTRPFTHQAHTRRR